MHVRIYELYLEVKQTDDGHVCIYGYPVHCRAAVAETLAGMYHCMLLAAEKALHSGSISCSGIYSQGLYIIMSFYN